MAFPQQNHLSKEKGTVGQDLHIYHSISLMFDNWQVKKLGKAGSRGMKVVPMTAHSHIQVINTLMNRDKSTRLK